MARIEINQVSKVYSNGMTAVDNINIDVADGEFIVLVGPSGCGKSTLLRMVAGLEDISSGEVKIGSKVVNKTDPADRDIAMVFQNYALYPHMTVHDNLAYGLKNRGTPKPEIAARVAEAAKMLELEPYLDRKPRALSGGQRQRVAMGRAIVRKPAAFLFDEPLSNLDAKLRVSMRGEIRKLQRRLGTTSIYVTHDQLEAMTLADRLVVLNAGQIEQIGSPLDIYHKPASTFVAGFIGSPAMNLLKVTRSGDGWQVGSQPLPGARPQTTAAMLTIGLRAENLAITPADADGLTMKLDYIEELGAQRLLHGTVDGQALVVATAAEDAFADDIRIAIAPRDLHYFDAVSGKRIEGGSP
ncbi:MAG: sn-glycerol-3-phosphate import ATP-binding protein UgpC [Rhizobium sp.]|nr:sn-glycerol-3-phosphate import ATP-binding protein UgpC [Rhizobium sp.]